MLRKTGSSMICGSITPDRAIDEILAEALVAQNETGLGMPARDERTERRQMHRIGGAQPLVMRIGIANEVRRQRIEERPGRRGLNMLVHDTLDAVSVRFGGGLSPQAGGYRQAASCYVLAAAALTRPWSPVQLARDGPDLAGRRHQIATADIALTAMPIAKASGITP